MRQSISAICHVHSEWSYDGKWTLAELAREFKRRGYRALMMTEHDRGFTNEKWSDYREACRAGSSGDFLLVPGIEYSDPLNLTHVLVWGAASFLGEKLSTSTLLQLVSQQEAVAILAHPARLEAWRSFDTTWNEVLTGIELWNRKTDGWAPSKVATALLRPQSITLAGLDFHDRRQFFPLSMQFEIDGDLSEETLLMAFRSGHASPCLFRQPFSQVLTPASKFALSTAERMRRPLARAFRNFRRGNKNHRARLANLPN